MLVPPFSNQDESKFHGVRCGRLELIGDVGYLLGTSSTTFGSGHFL